MNTAKELDNHGAGGRLLGVALAERPASKQDTQAGTGVRVHQEQHRLSHIGGLLNAQRSHYAMVDRIVKEEYLGRIDQHGQERIHLVGEHPVDPVAQAVGNPRNRVPYDQIARYGKEHGNYAEREIVNQHLEAGAYLALHEAVEFLDAPARYGTHYHGPEEHGRIGAYDYSHRGHCACHAAPVSAYVFTGGESYKGREKILEHRGDHIGYALVWPPSAGNEDGGDKPPGNKCSDIGHYHGAQRPAELLYLFFHKV